jgi:transcriptional regulator with XRE-family HTH domain
LYNNTNSLLNNGWMKNRIKEIRKELHLTQVALADLCDTSMQQIQFLESGKRKLTQEWMERISKALKVEPWHLIVNPKTTFSSRDNELISRYHSLDDNLKKAVDAILLGNKKVK